MATDHRWVRILAPLAYVASVGGLVMVLVAGSTINGSRSWLQLGGMSIQPSEFAKLAVVIGMALVVAERTERRWGRGVGSLEVVGMLLIAGIPAVLILLQPDLGTMLVLSATVFGVLAVAGAGRTWLAGLTLGAVVGAIAAVSAGVLKPYQVDRFLAFMDPTLDPRGAGYNVEQARIAVGNGGLLGQGLFDGSQTRSGFVPEQHTDFIFTVAGEELGLVGAGILILLLAVVIWRALAISADAGDLFGRVAAAGIACWFGFQAFQNIGMCLGIMPVTGVPAAVRVLRRQLALRRHARARPAPEHPPEVIRPPPRSSARFDLSPVAGVDRVAAAWPNDLAGHADGSTADPAPFVGVAAGAGVMHRPLVADRAASRNETPMHIDVPARPPTLPVPRPALRRRRAAVIASVFALGTALLVPAAVAAPDDNGVFELDGNVIAEADAGTPPRPGQDWSDVFAGSDTAFVDTGIVPDPAPLSIFTQRCVQGRPRRARLAPQERLRPGQGRHHQRLRRGLQPAPVTPTSTSASTASRCRARPTSVSGSSRTTWLPIPGTPAGSTSSFTGQHKAGDLLVLSEFDEGGGGDHASRSSSGSAPAATRAAARSRRCSAATPARRRTATAATAAANVCANVNTAPILDADIPWNYVGKGGTRNMPTASFFEGGINLNAFFGQSSLLHQRRGRDPVLVRGQRCPQGPRPLELRASATPTSPSRPTP